MGWVTALLPAEDSSSGDFPSVEKAAVIPRANTHMWSQAQSKLPFLYHPRLLPWLGGFLQFRGRTDSHASEAHGGHTLPPVLLPVPANKFKVQSKRTQGLLQTLPNGGNSQLHPKLPLMANDQSYHADFSLCAMTLGDEWALRDHSC